MKTVSVIATVHNEHGLATSSALLALLEQLRPEVIFLEQTPAGLRDFRLGPPTGLEAAAVSLYHRMTDVPLVAADIPTPPIIERSDMDALYVAIDAHSPDHQGLFALQCDYTTAYGFAFLNSPHNARLCEELEELERAAVMALGDERLSKIHRMWRDIHELRETGMIDTIEAYCRQNTFERGVFLVGSAHRKSLHDKSLERAVEAATAVKWEFPGLIADTEARK